MGFKHNKWNLLAITKSELFPYEENYIYYL
ncbi:MAG: hypothetical protein ACJAZR_000037 [Sediminicola sp.]|jgi:hypothetical protein